MGTLAQELEQRLAPAMAHFQRKSGKSSKSFTVKLVQDDGSRVSGPPEDLGGPNRTKEMPIAKQAVCKSLGERGTFFRIHADIAGRVV